MTLVLNKVSLIHRIQCDNPIMSVLTRLGGDFAWISLTLTEPLYCLLSALFLDSLSLPIWFYLKQHRNGLSIDFSFFKKYSLCHPPTYSRLKATGLLMRPKLEPGLELGFFNVHIKYKLNSYASFSMLPFCINKMLHFC